MAYLRPDRSVLSGMYRANERLKLRWNGPEVTQRAPQEVHG